MTGGAPYAGKSLSSTEIVYGDGSVVRGPPLPSARFGHCMVDLLDGRIMLIGGDSTNEVWFYYPANRSFVRGPSLKLVRRFHTCAVFQSRIHQLRYCVLVAGISGEDLQGDWVPRVEVLDFSTPSSVWTESEYDFF